MSLSLESSYQQVIPLNSILYYLSLFCGTVIYYTYAYQGQAAPNIINERILWYKKHNRLISISQLLLLFGFIISFLLFIKKHINNFQSLSIYTLVLLLLFPLVAVLYYGGMSTSGKHYNLRRQGWLKPFVIGFVWSGIVTVYPCIVSSFEHNLNYYLTILNGLLFIKNFLFISVLCIMFDIKDYADDSNKQLKTFVVRVGLRKTIFFILLPLSIIGFGLFLSYAMLLNFCTTRILFNTVPFVLLISVAYSMYKRKSIFYYLSVIDGLMIIKAVCGILGMMII